MKSNRKFLNLVAALSVIMGLSAMVKAQAPALPGSPVEQPSDRYRIGPGDVLDVRVYNRPQLSREAIRVEGNGMIRMPLIEGEIQAACKTEGELGKDISTRYARYYRNLPVDVFIKEYHAREVALIGAVNEQGRYQMQRRIRLLELLTFAKGPSDKAGQTINIVRAPRADLCAASNDTAKSEGGFISFRLNDTLRGDATANPYVEPGDIVTVPEADQVYIVGNVYSPKSLPLREPITVSRAIAMAGGPLRDSKTDKIRIRRQTGDGTQTEMFVNLNAIAQKKAEDVQLRPNDIVEVSESTGKSIFRSLVGSVAPMAAQLPVRVIP
jgi:polysaccharide export outer membrane protein